MPGCLKDPGKWEDPGNCRLEKFQTSAWNVSRKNFLMDIHWNKKNSFAKMLQF